jgi:hypothetical protein
MKTGESLQYPSKCFTSDMLGSLHLLNMPLEDRLALGIAKARLRRGGPRRDSFAEVKRLEQWGESVYAPEGHLFSIQSEDSTFNITYPASTTYHELGFGLEPLLVGSPQDDEQSVFIADRIIANPKTSEDPGAPYAYSPYFQWQRLRVVDKKYIVDLISEDDIPGTALNPAPQKNAWLRYSDPWEDC